jgi:hypothetical protein
MHDGEERGPISTNQEEGRGTERERERGQSARRRKRENKRRPKRRESKRRRKRREAAPPSSCSDRLLTMSPVTAYSSQKSVLYKSLYHSTTRGSIFGTHRPARRPCQFFWGVIGASPCSPRCSLLVLIARASRERAVVVVVRGGGAKLLGIVTANHPAIFFMVYGLLGLCY